MKSTPVFFQTGNNFGHKTLLALLMPRHGARHMPLTASGAGEHAELPALREYRTGDTQARIYWKASARMGRLIVRECAMERDAGAGLRACAERRAWLPGALFGALVALVAVGGAGRLFTSETTARSGFLDTVRFDGVASIRADDAVAFRVDFGSAGAAAMRGGTPYWRMIVLDEYRDRAFRLSAKLRATFAGRKDVRKIVGAKSPDPEANAGTWTFLLEPDAWTHLPLPESFSEIAFAAPIAARVSESLGVVDLERAPRRALAYRAVVNAEHGLRVRGRSGMRSAEFDAGGGGINLDAPDRAVLADAAREIRGGREMGALEFARAASAWLGARHAYALHAGTVRDAGRDGGDPLVRWAVSRAAGHCELFAGALVLLMREAGFSARVVAGFAGGELDGEYLVVRNSHAHAWCEVFDETASDGAGAWVRVDPTPPSGLAARAAAHAVRAKIAAIVLLVLAGVSAWVLSSRAGGSKGAREKWRAPPPRASGETQARSEAGRWLRILGAGADANAGSGADAGGVRADLLRVRYGRRESWPDLAATWRNAKAASRARIFTKSFFNQSD